MIRTMDKVFNQTAVDVTLKSEILKKAGINVIEPIKGISNRPENKTIIIYPDYSSLKGARDALSLKERDALKVNIEKLNLRLDKTIKDNHKEIGLDPNSKLKLSIDDFRVDPKTKKIFAVFEY
jgi:autotransporter translocation and assembly factor TamB